MINTVRLALGVIAAVMVTACEHQLTTAPHQSAPSPSYVVSATDNLTEAEVDTLRLLARIVGYGVSSYAKDDALFPNSAGYEQWTSATTPLGIFPPSVKHDATYNVTKDGAVYEPQLTSGDYQLTSGLRDDFVEVPSLVCDVVGSGDLFVRTPHTARWNYYFYSNLAHITVGPVSDSDRSYCPNKSVSCEDYNATDTETGGEDGSCSTGGGGSSDYGYLDSNGDGQIGGSELCSGLELSPGCYDVYVDGFYSDTVCC